ncbi:DUF5302 domain-containing protein [Ruania suaedae]|uniref:DUF5302 domain-containing protein n=1 Tax=Ruania suaedae TaxID=2897774 RepID=UPI001E484D2D|nr:DUF5302 domain-containing protein [Ruania suaedae]UFU04211.1 DUF5302 domain-containing protein [Ruania suaedae]
MAHAPHAEEAGAPEREDPMAAAKARMREALDRKAERDHPSAQGARNTGQVHGPEVEGSGGRRVFRRKSG